MEESKVRGGRLVILSCRCAHRHMRLCQSLQDSSRSRSCAEGKLHRFWSERDSYTCEDRPPGGAEFVARPLHF